MDDSHGRFTIRNGFVFVSPEHSSERDYVITHSVLCSMYICGNLQN